MICSFTDDIRFPILMARVLIFIITEKLIEKGVDTVKCIIRMIMVYPTKFYGK